MLLVNFGLVAEISLKVLLLPAKKSIKIQLQKYLILIFNNFLTEFRKKHMHCAKYRLKLPKNVLKELRPLTKLI